MRMRVVSKQIGDGVDEVQRNVQFDHEGVTLSMNVGFGSYTENRDGLRPSKRLGAAEHDTRRGASEHDTAEMALWIDGETMREIDGDTVMGWVPLDRLPALLDVLVSPSDPETRIGMMVDILRGSHE